MILGRATFNRHLVIADLFANELFIATKGNYASTFKPSPADVGGERAT
ncbi:hypothetical protein O9992_21890 [Vibrio lentus]|nr:hypothetical protein [Vibrio lentus]